MALGTSAKALLELIAERGDEIETRYGLRLILSAAVDIGGAAVEDGEGTPGGRASGAPQRRRCGGSVCAVRSARHDRQEVIGESGADVLSKRRPPIWLTANRAARISSRHWSGAWRSSAPTRGRSSCSIEEIHELARQNGCGVHISAATAAALPTLDVGRVLPGRRDAAGDRGDSQRVDQLHSDAHAAGRMLTYETALKEAQALGIAETDPSLDVEGRDTANKIVLIANRLFGLSLGPKDVTVEGITRVTRGRFAAAQEAGQVIKLIGTARRTGSGVQLSVAPKRLEKEHPLASVNGSEKAISYLTDTMHRITVSGGKSSPVGAAAALLKDLINAF